MLGYSILLFLLRIGVWLSALFNNKNKKLLKGQKIISDTITRQPIFSNQEFVVWIHSASLGEFEQARPLIDSIKKEKPTTKILLTFFSPSGYEIRKSYPDADYVTYLPFDSPANAQKFISCFNPKIALFVKYEFWYYHLKALQEAQIPVFSVSTILRPNQIFFKRQTAYNNVLKFFDYYFVQNKESQELLKTIGITKCCISGDTRFDRVSSLLKDNTPNLEDIKPFCRQKTTIVIGSLWLSDLHYLHQLILKSKDINIIIAPHEIDAENIAAIQKKLNHQAILLSEVNNNEKSNILIVDCIGRLTDIYSLADIAYVGGAFEHGLHNILEPAVFGVPVIFGPKYEKFQEALDLTKLNGAFSIKSINDLNHIFNRLKTDLTFRKKAGDICAKYINNKTGATEIIMKHLSAYLDL